MVGTFHDLLLEYGLATLLTPDTNLAQQRLLEPSHLLYPGAVSSLLGGGILSAGFYKISSPRFA